ncbi:hypothetical protein BDZ89DRAFT_1092046 [Hymenopellis radicata]|nr:hypothetical protein BDZ89DRAFT_1092046 [Hymenopellis radicata]
MNRPRTNANLDKARFAANDLGERTPSNKLLWKGLRHADFSKPVRYFMWMLMHDAYKVGSWWESKPGLEHRGKCEECGDTESMEHILFQCQAPGQRETWEMIGRLWQKKGSRLCELNFENLLASADDEEITGDTRLLRIAITEAAHLIWRLRNERVIQNEAEHKLTKREIRNRLVYALNDRLQLDQAAIRKKKSTKHGGISPEAMMATWQGTIVNERDLPPTGPGKPGF